MDGYVDLLNVVDDLGLAGHVAPVQWGIRLLVTWQSRLLELAGHSSGDRSVRREDAHLSVAASAIRASMSCSRQVMELAGARSRDRATTIPYVREPWSLLSVNPPQSQLVFRLDQPSRT